MGLLDELKSERSQVELNAATTAEAERKKQLFYEEHLNPRMKKLYMYLHELCDHLRFLDQKITATYHYPGVGPIDGFTQSNYRLAVDSAEQMKKITLKFECARENPISVIINSEKNAPVLEDFLKSQHIVYMDRKVRPEGMVDLHQEFEFPGHVHTDFEFSIDMDNLSIEFTAYNFPDWGVKRLLFKPHELKSEVFDEIGRFLLRQETDLFKTKLTKDELENIQQLTENAQKQHRKDTLLAKLYSPKDNVSKKESKSTSFFNKLLHK